MIQQPLPRHRSWSTTYLTQHMTQNPCQDKSLGSTKDSTKHTIQIPCQDRSFLVNGKSHANMIQNPCQDRSFLINSHRRKCNTTKYNASLISSWRRMHYHITKASPKRRRVQSICKPYRWWCNRLLWNLWHAKYIHHPEWSYIRTKRNANPQNCGKINLIRWNRTHGEACLHHPQISQRQFITGCSSTMTNHT